MFFYKNLSLYPAAQEQSEKTKEPRATKVFSGNCSWDLENCTSLFTCRGDSESNNPVLPTPTWVLPMKGEASFLPLCGEWHGTCNCLGTWYHPWQSRLHVDIREWEHNESTVSSAKSALDFVVDFLIIQYNMRRCVQLVKLQCSKTVNLLCIHEHAFSSMTKAVRKFRFGGWS